MKQIAVAAVIALCAALPAKADVRFIGALVTTSATNCAYTTAGDTRISTYRPPGEAGNPNSGGLSMYFQGGGYIVEFPGPIPALNTFQTVASVETGAFGFDTYNTRIKFSARTVVAAGTHTVFLRGVIEEPFGEKFSPGACVVGFEASLVRQQ